MIYRIELDGNNIYGTQSDLSLVSPSVSIELNSAGSSHFTMPKGHKYYETPKLLSSDIDIYENDVLIWYGRVLEINMSMDLNKEIIGEGPLAFFNDSIQRPHTYKDVTARSFFESIIANHNSQMDVSLPDASRRKFEIGNVTVDPYARITYETNYETTKDVLESVCLGAEGGYFFFRKENGVNYIDWLADLEEVSIQPVKFGLNLVDISKNIAGSNIKTSILPLGMEVDGQRVTIANLPGQGGRDYLDSDYVDDYGRIMEVVEFDDIGNPSDLLAAAEKWLANQDLRPLTVNCNAAELNYLNDAYPAFKVGQKVPVESEPHQIESMLLPLTKIDINMDDAVKKIQIGTPEKRELSEIYKSGSGGMSGGGSSGGGGGGGGGGTSYTAGPGIRIAGDAISVRLGYGLAINSLTGNIDVTIQPTPSGGDVYSGGSMYSNIAPITDIRIGENATYQNQGMVSEYMTDGVPYETEEEGD